MQGGIVGSVCFLALLLSVGAEDLVATSREDLGSVASLPELSPVSSVNEDEELRSPVDKVVNLHAEHEEAGNDDVRDAKDADERPDQSESLNQKSNTRRTVSVTQNSEDSDDTSRNFAQAQAKAVAQNAGSQSLPQKPFMPAYPLDQGLGSQSQTQATANAQAQSNNVYNTNNALLAAFNPKMNSGNPLRYMDNVRPNVYSQPLMNQDLSSASANAAALANSGANSPNLGFAPYNGGNSYPYYRYENPLNNQASSSASAQAEAVANGGNHVFNNPSLPYYGNMPYKSMPGSTASSSATAQANSGDNLAYGAGQGLYNPYVNGLRPNNGASSSAQAEAVAISRKSLGGPLEVLYSADSTHSSLGSVENLENEERRRSSSEEEHSSERRDVSLEDSKSGFGSSLSLFNGARSRKLTPDEYIYPFKMEGGMGVIQCNQKHQLFNLWTPDLDCLVCICVSEYNRLMPLCASCASCRMNPEPPLPAPVPVPVPAPEPYPVTVRPYPQPVPAPVLDVTCKPLPSGKPFTNPLNPCQLCICMEAVNALGQPDVQIECKENPQCVLPPDVTPIIPDGPVPVPLPLCEKFPPNVLFPHPTDMCKLCKCVVEMSVYGVPQQEITCSPNPDCAPVPLPIVTPVPVIDVTVVPVPWPPAPLNPVPVPIGPLPGPSPHESCRPFPPNQVFQHPWDDCRVCLCTEAYATGMITVEVNCYTKPSCCVEAPEQYVLPQVMPYNNLPGPVYPVYPAGGSSSAVANAEAAANTYNNQQQALAESNAVAQTGSSLGNSGSYLFPGQYQPSQSLAQAEANAMAQTGSNLGNTGGYLLPGQYQPSQGLAQAEANAAAQTGSYLGNSGGYLFPGQYQPSQSQAQAEANALAQAGNNLGNSGSYLFPGQYQPSQSLAQAEANAAAQTGSNLGNSGGYLFPGQYQPSQSQAQAEANALAQTGISHGNVGNYFFGQPSQPSGALPVGGQTSAVANAESQAQGNSLNQNYLAGLNPSYLNLGNLNQGYVNPAYNLDNLVNQGSSASASADAQAQSNANLAGYGGYSDLSGLLNANPYLAQSVPASSLYPSLYKRPSFEVTSLYQPGSFRDTSSSAKATAQSAASGSNAKSQAAANVVAGGNRFFGKSGNPEESRESRESKEVE